MIADTDALRRGSLADFFQGAGFRAEASLSVEELLDRVLERENAVLLLSSDFSGSGSLADLIYLLKVLNDGLKVILFGELTPLETRQVREMGVFYLALRPVVPGDTEELRQAVASALQVEISGAETPQVPSQQDPPAGSGWGKTLSRFLLQRVLPGVACLLVLALGAQQVISQQVPAGSGGNSLATWLFDHSQSPSPSWFTHPPACSLFPPAGA